MITFRPMSPLAASIRAAPRRPRPSLRRGLAAAIAMSFVAAPSRAQLLVAPTLSHLDDAAPVPAGMLRLSIANGWTRFDERFTATGTSPLNQELSTGLLGSTQLPLLTPIENGFRTLSGNTNTRLSFGQLQVAGDARIVTTPIAFDFGVTSRLSVGVVVPIVQTRRIAVAHVNERKLSPVRANVGVIPPTLRGAAFGRNATVAADIQRAADSLGARIARCQQNPAAAECAAVNANASDAAATRGLAIAYAAAIRSLGADSTHTLLGPRVGSQLSRDIEQQRLALNQRLQQYLGSGYGASAAIYLAPFDFSYVDLQGRNSTGTAGLLAGPLGGGLDSIATTERFNFGDISVGARYLVIDRFQHDTLPLRALQSRLALGAAIRFPTSRPDSAQNLVDIPTGDGAGVELRSAMDVIVRRVGSTIAARYVKAFPRTVTAALYGDPEAPFPFPVFAQRKRTAGTVLALDVTPRLLLDESFSIDGHYGLEHVGATTYDQPAMIALDCGGCAAPPVVAVSGEGRTAHRLGLGVRFSTLDAYLRGRASYPVEVSFAHLATISGDPGVPRATRDQIQLRIYYRLIKR